MNGRRAEDTRVAKFGAARVDFSRREVAASPFDIAKTTSPPRLPTADGVLSTGSRAWGCGLPAPHAPRPTPTAARDPSSRRQTLPRAAKAQREALRAA
jgi:hypothetical protein